MQEREIMLQRIYVDTSVIGGCEDEEFSMWSNVLMDGFRKGSWIILVSDLTLAELENAPKSVQAILKSIGRKNIENVFLNDEARALSTKYMENNVVGKKHVADAQHIAIASVERADVLVSWNFKHIVNLDRIRAFNSVNMKLGYPLLEIRTPREIVYGEKV